MKLLSFIGVLLLIMIIKLCSGRPQHYYNDSYEDHIASGTGKDKEEPEPVGGKVQIKVYRGPSKGHGHHKFAPWGYWVKQPEDQPPPEEEEKDDKH